MNIGIVGLGLIGGTYAKALRKYPYKLYGIDINEDTLSYAKENNIVDVATNDPKSVLKDLDVVFICLYPKEVVQFVRKNINYFKRGAIISDVAGIKRQIISQLDMYYDDDVEFVFTHPVAGRETIGIKYSDEAIFHNANFIITPTKRNTDEALNLIEILAKQMGFANVSRLTDTQHDEVIAYTSQLTHAIAISLVNSDNDQFITKRFIGDSYKDLTRISKINAPLWSSLFLNNKDFLKRKIEDFEKELDLLKKALDTKDEALLISLMEQATLKRTKIDE